MRGSGGIGKWVMQVRGEFGVEMFGWDGMKGYTVGLGFVGIGLCQNTKKRS